MNRRQDSERGRGGRMDERRMRDRWEDRGPGEGWDDERLDPDRYGANDRYGRFASAREYPGQWSRRGEGWERGERFEGDWYPRFGREGGYGGAWGYGAESQPRWNRPETSLDRDRGGAPGGESWGGYGPVGDMDTGFGPSGYRRRGLGAMGRMGQMNGPGGMGYRSDMRVSNAERGMDPTQRRGRGPRNYQRSDERIREDICDRLMAHEWIDSSDVDVKVERGEVTLTGTIDRRDAKRAIEDLCEDVIGVHDVHNQIRVARPDEMHASSTGVSQVGTSTQASSGDKGTTPKNGPRA